MPSIIKPLRLGVLHQVLRTGVTSRLAVTVMAFFEFGARGELLIEGSAWPRVAKLLDEGQALDIGMPKANGEVLLGGSGVAAGRRPVTALELTLRLGRIDKRLLAVGPRFWKAGALGGYAQTEALPFIEVPLGFGASFGGPSFEVNPVGRGHDSVALLDQGEAAPLPLLFDPRAMVSRIDDIATPAAFGPLGMAWPQRQRHLGTIDALWAANHWPAYPQDLDFRLFNAAPADQQVERFFAGNESFVLGGMNADAPVISGELPGVTSRCFVKSTREPDGPLREVPMKLDTAWLFGCERLGALVFHGVVQVQDRNADDISHVMAGWERLGDDPRPQSHYEQVFVQRTQGELRAAAWFKDSDLGPVVPPEEQHRRAAMRLELGKRKAAEHQQRAQARQDKLKRDMGFDEPWGEAQKIAAQHAPDTTVELPGQRAMLPIPSITQEDIERMDFDLEEILAAIDENVEHAKQEAGDPEQLRDEHLAEIDAKLAEHGINRNDGEEERQRTRVERLAAAKPVTFVASLADLDEVLTAIESNDVPDEARERVRDGMSFEQLDEMLQKARLSSPEALVKAQPLLAPVAAYFGELVQRGIAANISYAGRDLAWIDLRGVDLRGRRLRGTMFECANLEGADLRGLDLTEAVFTGANLRSANFEGATLKGANLSNADATGANFSGADLSGASAIKTNFAYCTLTGANLDGIQGLLAVMNDADLTSAQLAKASFIQANLDRVRGDGADLTEAILLEVSLQRATLRHAGLARAIFMRANADESCFDNADLSGAMASIGSRFASASLRDVTAVGAGFRDSVLDRADFSGADLSGADLGRAKLRHAKLAKTSLRGALLSDADLQHAGLYQADLLDAVADGANFAHTNLERASLYRAFTDGACFDNARLAGANTLRAKIDRTSTDTVRASRKAKNGSR